MGGVSVEVPIWDSGANVRDDPWCLADCVSSGLWLLNKISGGFQLLTFKVWAHLQILHHSFFDKFIFCEKKCYVFGVIFSLGPIEK